MIEIDHHSVIRTTFNLGQQHDLIEVSKGLWNIFATTKASGRKTTLVIRDPRLPVTIVHPKGSITISGKHTLPYAFQCLKVIVEKIKSVKTNTHSPNLNQNEPTFQLCLMYGRFEIQTSNTERPRSIQKRSRSETLDYQEIERHFSGSQTPQGAENGWNVNLINIFLSKNYDWCVQHGVEDVFYTKRVSGRHEIEMKLSWNDSPGAAEISLRMTEHGVFRYTVQFQRKTFTAAATIHMSETEITSMKGLQEEIDSVKIKLNLFVNALYQDVLIPCQKKRIDLSSLV